MLSSAIGPSQQSQLIAIAIRTTIRHSLDHRPGVALCLTMFSHTSLGSSSLEDPFGAKTDFSFPTQSGDTLSFASIVNS